MQAVLLSQVISRSRESSSDRVDPVLAIGDVAERTGLAVSAIRFYETKGLITSTRAPSGHRRFRRSMIRRLSFVLISQRLGYSLDEIKAQLDRLPEGRNPTERDWSRLTQEFASDIEARISGLQLLRSKLDECIGCGCLSLATCGVWNPGDAAAELGEGPRFLLGDTTDDLPTDCGSVGSYGNRPADHRADHSAIRRHRRLVRKHVPDLATLART